MSETIVVTTTFYKSTDELRFQLAYQMIREAKAAQYPVIIVDGSPNPQIAEKFRRLGAIVYPEIWKGMAASRRQAFLCATNYANFELNVHPEQTILFWTEPEKIDIIRLIPEIITPIVEAGFSICIPTRSAKSLQTYPGFQRFSESAANLAYQDYTGRQGYDPMFGPVAFCAQTLLDLIHWNPATLGCKTEYHHHLWPLLIEPNHTTKVEVDFVYPSDQRMAEEAEAQQSGKILKKRRSQQENLTCAYKIMGAYNRRVFRLT